MLIYLGHLSKFEYKRSNLYLIHDCNYIKSYICTVVEETNIEVILAVMNTTELVVKIRP